MTEPIQTHDYLVEIGNTDNKLTQQEWSRFCQEVYATLESYADSVWFVGHSPSDAPWQNMALHFSVPDSEGTVRLEAHLDHIRQTYNQDSIFFGEVKIGFIG